MTLPDAFSPLRNRNFATFFTAQTLSLVGTWAQRATTGYVMLQLTNSPGELGLMIALFAIPMILTTPFAGAISDRGNRRLLLLACQVVAAIIALAIALLLAAGALAAWHMHVFNILLGVVFALDQPTADAITADMNETDEIRKASLLMGLAQFVGRIGGPIMSGLLLALFTPATVFFFDALSFIPVILALLFLLRGISQARAAATGNSLLQDFGTALRYVRTEARIADILFCTFIQTILSLVSLVLYPSFVKFVLGGDGVAMSVVQGALGLGGLLSILLIAPQLLKIPRTGLLLISLMLFNGFGILVLGLAARNLFVTSLLAGLETSAGAASYVINVGLLSRMAVQEMRGRVLSLYSLAIVGSQLPGALLTGYLGETIGPAMALAVLGALLMAFAVLMFVLRRGLATWRYQPA